MRSLVLIILMTSCILAETVIASATATLTYNTNTYVYLTTLTLTELAKPVYKLVYIRGIYTLVNTITMPYYQAYTANCVGKAIVAMPSFILKLVAPVLATTILNVTTHIVHELYTITVAKPFSTVLSNSMFLTSRSSTIMRPLSTTVTLAREAFVSAKATVIPYSAITCTYNAPYNVTYIVGNGVESIDNIVLTYKKPLTVTVRLTTKYTELQTFPIKAVENGTASVTVYEVKYYYTPLPSQGIPSVALIALLSASLKRRRGKREGIHKGECS